MNCKRRFVAGDRVQGVDMPETLIVADHPQGSDWIRASDLADQLGVRLPQLYPFVKKGLLTTVYALPHLTRWYRFLDRDAVFAADAQRRLRKRSR